MKIIKLLWISLNAPTEKAEKAGSATFNHYFKEFYNDERFDIKVIAQINNSLPVMKLKDGDGFFLTRGGGLKAKLKRLSSIESKYNPFNRNANLISNSMVAFVKKNIEKLKSEGFLPEIVVLEWTQCVVLADMVHRLLPDAKLVASEHDVTFVGYERKSKFYSGLQGFHWKHKYKWEKKKELRALSMCSLILPHNADNLEVLTAEGVEKSKIQHLVPYYNNLSSCVRNPRGKDVLFFGAMSRPENYLSAIWFIEKVMPLLEDDSIRFVILGSNPDERLKKYINKRVILTGFVDSIVPYFEQSMCLAAPLVLGAGIKVKILEAISSGIPVLTNRIGIEGIPAKDGVEYYHCEKPEEYVSVIKKLAEGRLSGNAEEAAREFITKMFSFEKSLNNYKERIIKLSEE